MQTHAQLTPPVQSQGVRGPVTCITWIQQRDPSKEMLCYGTGLGYLVLWRRDGRMFEELVARRIGTGTGTEILAIASDGSLAELARIVLGTQDRLVQVHRVDSRAQLHPVFSIQLSITVPWRVSFVNNTARDVYVFGIYNGQMCALFNSSRCRF